MEIKNKSKKREVFCRFIRKGGKTIYPKNARFFHFWVEDSIIENDQAQQTTVFDDNDKN